MSLSRHPTLAKLAAAKVLLTLTGPYNGQTIEVTLKFVAEVQDPLPNTPALWCSFATAGPNQAVEADIIACWALARTPLTAIVAIEGSRIEFTTTVTERRKHLWINERVMIDGVRIADPARLTDVNLRTEPRYRTSDSAGGIYGTLIVNNKAIAGGSLWDISAGGASFLVPMDRTLMGLPKGQPFECHIIFRGQKLLLKGKLTHTKTFSTRTLRLGLKFAKGANETAPAMVAALTSAIRQLESQKAAA